MSGHLVAMLFVFAAAAPLPAQSQFRFFEPVQPPRAVQVIAHRGLWTLAPENSRYAVRACADDFIEWAEIDVRLTRDGRHVVIHDETVDATTNGHGRVADLTFEQLESLDAGSWFAPRFRGTRICSLHEVLDAARGKVNLYLDCKDVDPDLLVRDLRDAMMTSQVVVYDSPEGLARIREAAGNTVATMARFRPQMMSIEEFVKQVDPAAVEIDADDLTPELCRGFHDRRIRVEAKVLGDNRDNPATWTRMLDAGVDWIQTDNAPGVRFCEVRRRVPEFPVQIAFHRGADRYAPENTQESIRLAAALGADYIEVDIRMTRDGRFVLLHDGSLDRTTSGHGPVGELAAEAVMKLDAGSWFGKPFAGTPVPSLTDGLAALGAHSRGYLDAKDIPPEQLLAAIRAHQLMKRHVVYQSADYCRRLKALDPNLRVLPPLKSPADLDDLIADLHPFGVDTAWPILSAELITRCHAAGVQVFSDALGFHENVASYRQAMGWGIDVIQTDHPLRVLRAIELSEESRTR